MRYGVVALSNGHFVRLPSIPYGEEILFESDIAIVNYELTVEEDDGLLYVTKGSAAGGNVGGSLRTGSTWTQPAHSHVADIEPSGEHTHDAAHTHSFNHEHTLTGHVLTIGELPPHTHGYYEKEISGSYAADTDSSIADGGYASSNTDGGNVGSGGSTLAHSHATESCDPTTTSSASITTSSNPAHTHPTAISEESPASSWRPYGRCYTKQRRIY
jgi:hypothetical protein